MTNVSQRRTSSFNSSIMNTHTTPTNEEMQLLAKHRVVNNGLTQENNNGEFIRLAESSDSACNNR